MIEIIAIAIMIIIIVISRAFSRAAIACERAPNAPLSLATPPRDILSPIATPSAPAPAPPPATSSAPAPPKTSPKSRAHGEKRVIFAPRITVRTFNINNGDIIEQHSRQI